MGNLKKRFLMNYVEDGAYTRLPKEYQEVEYITFDGNSYIDTNYNATTQNLQTSLETSVDYSWNGTNYGSILGEGVPNKRYDVLIWDNSGTNAYVIGYGTNGRIVSQTLNANTKYNINYSYVKTTPYSNVYLKHNNSTIQTITGYDTWDNIRPIRNIILGAVNSSGTYGYFGGNIYSCKIYGDGILVRSFIPCYRKADNEVGLYDMVSQTFFTNQGTGTFAKGDNVYYLPKEYQEVEYIESSGIQYINTNYSFSDGIEIKTKAQFTNDNSTTNQVIIWAENSASPWGCVGFRATRSNAPNVSLQKMFSYGDGTGGIYTTLAYSSATIYEIDYKLKSTECSININGTSFTTTTHYSSATTTNNLYMFVQNSGGTADSFAQAKIYCLKIYNNSNQLVRYFKPCYRKSDNEIGLYDCVNNVFYTNQGTGSFSKGENVYYGLPSEYQKVEYIQSSGTQWFNSGYNPTSSTGVKMTTQYEIPSSSTKTFFASRRMSPFANYGVGIRTSGGHNGYQINSIEVSPDDLGTLTSAKFVEILFNYNANRKLYIDNTLIYTLESRDSVGGSELPMYILAFNGDGTTYQIISAKIKSMRIYENTTPQRVFVPCYRKNGGEIGLYDIVNGTFYANSGTGSFTKGADDYDIIG